ncbi:MAG: hypothetical protein K0A94_04700 [Desulfuromonadales bacterium]|nr:hypothetical protein [Desulfuromonadales bacterium]
MKLKKIKSYFNYLREIYIWLLDARLGFVFVLVLIFAILMPVYVCQSEESIRISGYILQLLGMILAIRGVLKIREYFMQPKLMFMIGSWLKNFPKWRKQGLVESPSVHVSTKIRTGNLYVLSTDNPDLSLEKRFEAVLKNQEILKINQRHTDHQVYKIIEEHLKVKDDVEESTETIKEYLNIKLEETHTDGILVSLIGLIWLTFGITLSTFSYEISELIK